VRESNSQSGGERVTDRRESNGQPRGGRETVIQERETVSQEVRDRNSQPGGETETVSQEVREKQSARR
jgi:hypothetical protein